MPPEKILEQLKNGNLIVKPKGIADWIKALILIVTIVVQGLGVYYAIKLEIQSLSINAEYMKLKNIEQDARFKEIENKIEKLQERKLY